MTLSEMLALLMGIYAAGAGAGVLVDPGKVDRLFAVLRGNAVLSYVTGMFVYFFCAGVLVAHHGVDSGKAMVVTVLYAAGAVEGLLFLIVPRAFLGLFTSMLRPGSARVWGAVAMLIGAGLMVLAFV
jgi:hypothetical protein